MAGVRWQVEPLGLWTWPITENRSSTASFRATWADTLDALVAEADRLDLQGVIALRVDADPGDIRRDGMLRTKARIGFPGVAVSFTSGLHGPLTYATDQYEQQWTGTMPGWQANVRAIVLALEALRALDRWGVSKRGEAYVGWRQIEAGPRTNEHGDPFLTADEATRWVREQVPGTDAGGGTLPQIIRAARQKLHPDRTGDRATWDRLERALDLMAGRTKL